MTSNTYKVQFQSCEGNRWTKTFKSLEGLRKAITYQIGQNFDISRSGYATDGYCTARIQGTTWEVLFPSHFDQEG